MPQYYGLNGLTQLQPDNTIDTLQNLLALAKSQQVNTQPQQTQQQPIQQPVQQPMDMNSLLPQLPQTRPQGNIMGMPSNDFVNIMGTAAHAIAPNTWGGRLGAGMVNLQEQNRQNEMRDLAARVGLGRYGMEQQDYQRKLSMQDALDKSKAGIMGRLNQPGGYEDYDQGMSVPTPSPIEGMWKEDPFKAAAFQMEAQSNAPNFAPFVKSDTSNLNSLLSHFTPASVYEYSKTGDMSALQREVSSKEFNMPASLDEILPPIVAKHGIDMSTSQGRVAGYQLYAQNPQVQKEYQREKDRQRLIAPSSNIFIGTNPETGNPLIMPSRGTPNLREVPSPSGGIAPKNLSEDYKKDKTAISQAKDLVGQLRGAWDTLAITTRQSAVQSAVKGKVGLSPDAKLYMDAKSAFLGNLSRSLAAERGVLTQQDIERIDKALASVSLNPISADSQAEALKKWKMVENIINSAEKRMAERNLMTYKNPTGTSGTKLPEGFKSGW
jgi:hypothetical protein